jgi:hypothetical protein
MCVYKCVYECLYDCVSVNECICVWAHMRGVMKALNVKSIFQKEGAGSFYSAMYQQNINGLDRGST